MGKIIAICNQKGGVGKTTTAINVGIGLVRKGYKVLLVDVDAQGSLTAGLGVDQPDKLDNTLADIMNIVIESEVPDIEAVILHHNEGIDYIPSNIDLAGLEIKLTNIISRETVLSQCLEDLKENYDYIILDCTPSLGTLTINVLTAADEVMIPIQAQYLSLKGLEQLLKSISQVRKRTNKGLQIAGILLTMVDSRTICARTVMEMLYEAYVEESSLQGVSIYAIDEEGKASKAYQALTEEVLGVDE